MRPGFIRYLGPYRHVSNFSRLRPPLASMGVLVCEMPCASPPGALDESAFMHGALGLVHQAAAFVCLLSTLRHLIRTFQLERAGYATDFVYQTRMLQVTSVLCFEVH
jgi:hypothetical protein